MEEMKLRLRAHDLDTFTLSGNATSLFVFSPSVKPVHLLTAVCVIKTRIDHAQTGTFCEAEVWYLYGCLYCPVACVWYGTALTVEERLQIKSSICPSFYQSIVNWLHSGGAIQVRKNMGELQLHIISYSATEDG